MWNAGFKLTLFGCVVCVWCVGLASLDVVCVAWLCLVCFLLCKEEGSSPVSLQLLRGGIWDCMRCPCLCLVLVCEYMGGTRGSGLCLV